MHRFENQRISRNHCPIRHGPKEWRNSFDFTQNIFLQDLEFSGCEFIGEGLASYGAPLHRSEARHLRLQNCVTNGFFGTGAIFDDIVVDGLRTGRAPVILFGCALREVVLTGNCGRFLLNGRVCHDDEKRNAAFHSSNSSFYETVDWALDISGLKTSGLEIRGTIPSRLIRRNPEEHFIMTRSVALSGDWKNHEPYGSFEIAVSIFVDSGAEDNLFVAPRLSKRFKDEIEFFHRLRTAGLVS